MKKTSTGKRLLSLLMSAVMVLSLLPTAALAVDDPPLPAVNAEGTYKVTFRQDAATRTEVGVTPVDNNGDELSGISGVTLGGVTFDLEKVDGGAIYVDSLVSGYGLLTVEANGKDYYFNHATWGKMALLSRRSRMLT